MRPDNGRLDGRTRIEIIGKGFLQGATVQMVTGTNFSEALSVEVISNELIVAITPSSNSQPGLVDIRVTNPDRQRTLYENGFTYNPLPVISKITPSYGLATGGTVITIAGTGFLPGAKVLIGKSPATTEFKNQSSLKAVTPPNSPGTLDLKVINPDSQEITAPAAFLFVSETVYNYPNPFRASQGTTFRYVSNEEVKEIRIQIFNLNGDPVGLLAQSGNSEIKWNNPNLNFGLYVYHMQVELNNGQTRIFQKLLQVQ